MHNYDRTQSHSTENFISLETRAVVFGESEQALTSEPCVSWVKHRLVWSESLYLSVKVLCVDLLLCQHRCFKNSAAHVVN